MTKAKASFAALNLRGYTSLRPYKGFKQLQEKDKAAVLDSICKARKRQIA